MLTHGEISSMTRMWKQKISSISSVGEKNYSEFSSVLSMDDGKTTLLSSKDPTFGADAILKTFYEGKNSSENCIDWVETAPRQLSKRAAKAHDRVAIKMYKVKDLEKPVISGRFALKYHMIDIQSPVLVEALKDIVKKENVHLELTEIARFTQPFRPLYFCFDEILALHQKSAEGCTLRIHLQLLLKVLADVFGSFKTHIKHLQSSHLISFKLAWAYFPKDSIVYSPGKDCERLCKVVDTELECRPGSKPRLIINCKELSFDGESFVWKDIKLSILYFDGNRPINELEHYPLSFHPDPESVKSRVSARGKRVLDYQGLTYCEYLGLGVYKDSVCEEKHNVSGRILIDVFGYNKHHLALRRREGKDLETINNRVNQQVFVDPNVALLHRTRELQNLAKVKNAADMQESTDSSYIHRLSEDDQKKNRDEMLARPEDLIYLSPILTGYALKNKLWLSFYVDDIKPMVWNDEAYDHLVYPEEQKDLLLSFVENHQRTKKEVVDVIKGKGEGLIMLLSGPPGTGKTLTAEAVADKTRRPLYYLQAEDLGINAATLGAKIKKVFEMATEWDAVILLDEADVFMAERSPNDIVRNELVSIFLRELEYFRGIIFLTTNLYDTIDTAFRSRVNIHLLFNPLAPTSRLILWRKFLDRLGAAEGKGCGMPLNLDEEDFKELAKWGLNGREIKNAIKTVKYWCDSKGYEMTLSRLESGIKVTAPQASKHDTGDSGLYD